MSMGDAERGRGTWVVILTASIALTAVILTSGPASAQQVGECPESYYTMVVDSFDNKPVIVTPAVSITAGETVKFVNNSKETVKIEFGDDSPFSTLSFKLYPGQSTCFTSLSNDKLGLDPKQPDGKAFAYTATRPDTSDQKPCEPLDQITAQPRIIVKPSS